MHFYNKQMSQIKYKIHKLPWTPILNTWHYSKYLCYLSEIYFNVSQIHGRMFYYLDMFLNIIWRPFSPVLILTIIKLLKTRKWIINSKTRITCICKQQLKGYIFTLSVSMHHSFCVFFWHFSYVICVWNRMCKPCHKTTIPVHL